MTKSIKPRQEDSGIINKNHAVRQLLGSIRVDGRIILKLGLNPVGWM